MIQRPVERGKGEVRQVGAATAPVRMRPKRERAEEGVGKERGALLLAELHAAGAPLEQ